MSKISFVKLVFHKTLTSKSINPSILQSLYSFLDGLVQKYLHLQATIRVRQLAYVACVDTYAHFFPINFSSFRNFSDSYEFTLFCLSLEETDYLLFAFVLNKSYFSIFHANYLINNSPYLIPFVNLGCH